MNLRYFLLLALVVAAILIGKYCCMPKNALVEIKSRIQAPMGVAFIEVKDGARQNVSGKIKVTFIDSAGQVMSANGIPLKTFEVTQVMSIGLSPAAVFSPDKPYLFYIKAEADGYETNVKPVVVTQNVPNYVPIYMAKLDALPPGGGLASAVGTTSALIGSSQTIVAGTGAQQFKLTFAEGTTFIADKKRVNPESRLSYSLLRGINNPLDSIGNTFTNQAFPGGAEVVNARDASGNIIATPASPFYFTTAGWFTMDIKTAEGQKVDAFSKPADVEMPLSKNLKNPITNAPLKVGDRIPLWSMNERTGVWRQEGETIVADAGNGQLKTSFKVSHLSTWNMDFMNGGCPAGTVISVINNSGLTGTFFSQYINASDRSVLTQKMVSLSAGIQLDVIRPPNVPGRIYVHQGSDVNTRLAARSSVLNCSSIISSCLNF